MKRSYTILFFLFALVLCPLVFASEGLDDSGISGDGGEDDHGIHSKRVVDVNLQGSDTVEIESETEVENDPANEDFKNKWSIEMKVENNNDHLARLQFEFFQLNDEAGTTVQFDLRIAELLEYVESNNILGYQAGEEVGTPYVGKDWEDIEVDTPRMVGNITIYSITCVTKDGVLTLRMRIADDLVVDPLDGYTLLPNLAKIDVEIDNYPRNNSQSNLVLVTRTRTETKIRQEGSTAVSFTKSGANMPFLGAFTWVDSVEADNVTVDVVASGIEQNADSEGTYYAVYFSFIRPGAAHYVWDPAVGAAAAGDAATLISWCSVVLSFVKHFLL